MDPANNWISQHDLLRTDHAMIVLTSAIFVARIIVQVWRRRTLEVQDVLLYIAFAAYLAFAILYVIITPIFFKLEALGKGEIAPWPEMAKDLKLASEVMWSSGIEYWTCLWFVKFSLLALYKKLLAGMPNAYLWSWWGTLIFCIVTWATCIITGPGLACNNTKQFFEKGILCSAPSEVKRQTANLYYAYAVDTLTNLMGTSVFYSVMVLPLRLIWNLRMERRRKIGVGLLFASGLVCVLFSTIRIVQVGGDGKPRSPDAKWLTMWTIIECSTAVIIGCCPVLASLIPKSKRPAHHPDHDPHGYVRQSPSRSNGTAPVAAPNNHRLKSMLSSKSRGVGHPNGSLWATENGSQEELAKSRVNGTGTKITAALREEHERRVAAKSNV